MKITICGNYGIGNLGDEAILDGLMKILNTSFPKAILTVMSSFPKQTTKNHGLNSIYYFPAGFRSFFYSIFSLNFFKTFKNIWNCDLFVLGGGGLFNDEKKKAVWIWFVQAIWPILLRKKLVMLGQSVGPLHSYFGKKLCKFVFMKAMLVTVRDQGSKKLLENLGIKKIYVYGDLALANGYDIEGKPRLEKTIVLSLRDWIDENSTEKDKIFVELIDFLFERYKLKTIFVPFQTNQHSDLDRATRLSKLLKYPESMIIILEKIDYRIATEIISKAKFCIGMRLHSIIFSLISVKPAIVISYSEKVRNFAEEAGFKEILDYQKINLKDLKNSIEHLLLDYDQLISILEKNKLKEIYTLFNHEKLLKMLF